MDIICMATTVLFFLYHEQCDCKRTTCNMTEEKNRRTNDHREQKKDKNPSIKCEMITDSCMLWNQSVFNLCDDKPDLHQISTHIKLPLSGGIVTLDHEFDPKTDTADGNNGWNFTGILNILSRVMGCSRSREEPGKDSSHTQRNVTTSDRKEIRVKTKDFIASGGDDDGVVDFYMQQIYPIANEERC